VWFESWQELVSYSTGSFHQLLVGLEHYR